MRQTAGQLASSMNQHGVLPIFLVNRCPQCMCHHLCRFSQQCMCCARKVPGFVESVLHSSHVAESGFDLRDAAYMASRLPLCLSFVVRSSAAALQLHDSSFEVATLEQLIFDSESALLEKAAAESGGRSILHTRSNAEREKEREREDLTGQCIWEGLPLGLWKERAGKRCNEQYECCYVLAQGCGCRFYSCCCIRAVSVSLQHTLSVFQIAQCRKPIAKPEPYNRSCKLHGIIYKRCKGHGDALSCDFSTGLRRVD